MSTLSRQIEAEIAKNLAKAKKPKAKRDEHGRFVKKTEDTADLTTPSF